MAIPKITSAEFTGAAVRLEQLPPASLPEVAFLGRSNVGKSSLINTLLGRKKLVRTSSRPGSTQALNFFLINGSFYFVDLPGFGYARVSRTQKEGWWRLIQGYLGSRPTLRGVVFLQDGRRLPGVEEQALWELLRNRGLGVIPVLTKADKLKAGERARQLKEIQAALDPFGVRPADLIWFSTLTHEGRNHLWSSITACLAGGGMR